MESNDDHGAHDSWHSNARTLLAHGSVGRLQITFVGFFETLP